MVTLFAIFVTYSVPLVKPRFSIELQVVRNTLQIIPKPRFINAFVVSSYQMKGGYKVNIKLMLDPEDPIRKSLEAMGINDDPDSNYLLIRRGGEVNYIASKYGLWSL